MMGDFYYVIGLVVMLMSFYTVYYYNKYFNIKLWKQSFKKISGSDPTTEDFRSKEDSSLHYAFNFFTNVQVYWFLIGIISKSWMIFLFLIFIHFIVQIVHNKTYSPSYGFFLFGFQILKLILIFLLIINHFHLHINWVDLL